MNNRLKAILAAVVIIILGVSPFIVNNYILSVLTTVMITALLAQSWNMISGYAGQFSFGQAAFFGIGAYTSVILYTQFGLTPWVGAIIGMVISALVGIFIGYLTSYCKIKGDYFALATLAFAEILRLVVYNSANTVFNGPSGIFVSFIKGGNFGLFQFTSWKTYFYIIFVIVIAVTFCMSRLKSTRYGLLLTSIRENETAADSLGVNVLGYKLSAIAISSAIAALAGAFYAQYYLFIEPSSVFGATISMEAIIPCIIGGAGTAIGPVIGSFIIVPIMEITNSLFPNISGLNMIIYGVLIVVFILFCPNGLIGVIRKWRAKRNKKEDA